MKRVFAIGLIAAGCAFALACVAATYIACFTEPPTNATSPWTSVALFSGIFATAFGGGGGILLMDVNA